MANKHYCERPCDCNFVNSNSFFFLCVKRHKTPRCTANFYKCCSKIKHFCHNNLKKNNSAKDLGSKIQNRCKVHVVCVNGENIWAAACVFCLFFILHLFFYNVYFYCVCIYISVYQSSTDGHGWGRLMNCP